ncbi:MAG TPA: DUF72 domain-containing protein [Gemmatimonadaceae bacterium]|jgi:uncharacterized protein YecE (DUF72 family)|nr:DUF72 domain-containing protein [Gemmatimonadaceae bacterium]
MKGGETAVDGTHDPGVEAARDRAATLSPIASHAVAAQHERDGAGALVYVGTAGWTDRTLTAPGVFYPPKTGSPEARLRYYASRFSMVEVDATYYALQPPETADRWVERTPPDFRFCVKAHALLTGHPSEPRRLPTDLQSALPTALVNKSRVYADDLPEEILTEVRRRFVQMVTPLAEAGRLGAVVFQMPPWVGPSRANARVVAALRDGFGDLPVAVEFRNRLWMADALRDRTVALLTRHALAYVMVDAPPGLESSMPPEVVVTSPAVAMVRLHGRRVETWERPGVSVAERYRYLYDRTQLREWIPRVSAAARESKYVHVVFNNCYGNYGTTNALEFVDLLHAAAAD